MVRRQAGGSLWSEEGCPCPLSRHLLCPLGTPHRWNCVVLVCGYVCPSPRSSSSPRSAWSTEGTGGTVATGCTVVLAAALPTGLQRQPTLPGLRRRGILNCLCAAPCSHFGGFPWWVLEVNPEGSP